MAEDVRVPDRLTPVSILPLPRPLNELYIAYNPFKSTYCELTEEAPLLKRWVQSMRSIDKSPYQTDSWEGHFYF